MAVAPIVTETVYALNGASLGPFETVWPYDARSLLAVEIDLGDGFGVVDGGSYVLAGHADTTQNGGAVTLSNALLPVSDAWPAHARLALIRSTTNDQPSSFGSGHGFDPAAAEAALDHLQRQIQEARAQLARVVTASPGDAALVFPQTALRAGRVLAFDDAGALDTLDPGFVANKANFDLTNTGSSIAAPAVFTGAAAARTYADRARAFPAFEDWNSGGGDDTYRVLDAAADMIANGGGKLVAGWASDTYRISATLPLVGRLQIEGRGGRRSAVTYGLVAPPTTLLWTGAPGGTLVAAGGQGGALGVGGRIAHMCLDGAGVADNTILIKDSENFVLEDATLLSGRVSTVHLSNSPGHLTYKPILRNLLIWQAAGGSYNGDCILADGDCSQGNDVTGAVLESIICQYFNGYGWHHRLGDGWDIRDLKLIAQGGAGFDGFIDPINLGWPCDGHRISRLQLSNKIKVGSHLDYCATTYLESCTTDGASEPFEMEGGGQFYVSGTANFGQRYGWDRFSGSPRESLYADDMAFGAVTGAAFQTRGGGLWTVGGTNGSVANNEVPNRGTALSVAGGAGAGATGSLFRGLAADFGADGLFAGDLPDLVFGLFPKEASGRAIEVGLFGGAAAGADRITVLIGDANVPGQGGVQCVCQRGGVRQTLNTFLPTNNLGEVQFAIRVTPARVQFMFRAVFNGAYAWRNPIYAQWQVLKDGGTGASAITNAAAIPPGALLEGVLVTSNDNAGHTVVLSDWKSVHLALT